MIDKEMTRKEIMEKLPIRNTLYEVKTRWHRIDDPFANGIVFSEHKTITDAYIRTDEDALVELDDHL